MLVTSLSMSIRCILCFGLPPHLATSIMGQQVTRRATKYRISTVNDAETVLRLFDDGSCRMVPPPIGPTNVHGIHMQSYQPLDMIPASSLHLHIATAATTAKPTKGKS